MKKLFRKYESWLIGAYCIGFFVMMSLMYFGVIGEFGFTLWWATGFLIVLFKLHK